MIILYLAIMALAGSVLAYVIYLSKKADLIIEEKKRKQEAWDEEQEKKRIAQLREEKRKLEKHKREEERRRQKVKMEMAPLLQNFVAQYVDSSLREFFPLIKEMLQGQSISITDLLQHNVNRRFADGKPYRVGLAREIQGRYISLSPEELERLQFYFVCVLDFLSVLRSKGMVIEAPQLEEMIEDESDRQWEEEKIPS